MRLIDADALERDGWKMSRTVRVDKDTMEIQTRKPTDFTLLPSALPEKQQGGIKMRIFEIYFSDLNEDAQSRLLKAVGAECASDMNWDIDVCPIAMYDFEEPKSACSDCQEFDCYGCENKEESK